ncbi:MAG: hypothetical protein KC549_12700 [Myxococcales bacterium]|nr:hypothetical protein [Myxococcales bacterium]MCB9546638.1 hypothetical protein [Myxococcales bacterium]
MGRWLVAVVLVGTLGGLACGTAPSVNDTGDLVQALQSYNRLIRWQRWNDAASFVPPEQRTAWLDKRMRGGAGLSIADVALAGVQQASAQAEEATVYVRIAWYRVPDTTLRESVWKQSWKLDRGEGWRLVAEEEATAPPGEAEPAPAWP